MTKILANGGTLIFVPDCYEDWKRCDNDVDNYFHALGSVPDCYKTQQMGNKAVSTYPSAIQLVPDRYKTKEICDKAIDTCPFVFDSVPDRYITPKLCNKVVSEDPVMFKHCHDKYKIYKMCDKAVDSYLLALKFVPNWFVTSKVIEKLDSATFSDDYIVFGYLDSGFVTFFINYIDLSSISLDNSNLDDDSFDYWDPETINHVKLMGWCNRFKHCKGPKKDMKT